MPGYWKSGDGSGAVTSDGIFCHVLVEVIQMQGADIAEFQMADGIIDPGQHIQVSVHGAGFDAGAFLQLKNILGIFSKSLVVVKVVAFL